MKKQTAHQWPLLKPTDTIAQHAAQFTECAKLITNITHKPRPNKLDRRSLEAIAAYLMARSSGAPFVYEHGTAKLRNFMHPAEKRPCCYKCNLARPHDRILTNPETL